MNISITLFRLRFILKLIGFFGFLSIPHILNKIGIKPELFRTWDQIATEFWKNNTHYLLSLLTTFYIGGLAIIISILIGISFGILFSYKDRWLGYFESVSKFIWSIPLIVVAVYLNIFINIPIIYIIITGVFLGHFQILSYTYKKGNEDNEGILSLVASFNLSKKNEFRHFRIREIIKNLNIPLAQSVPLSYIGVTMGEYTYGRVAGSDEYGLGIDFQYGMQYSKFEIVYVSIILMVFLVFISGEIFENFPIAKYYYNRIKEKISRK